MNSRDSDPPIACQPKALDAAQRQRQKELLEIVRGKIRRVIELDDGYEMGIAVRA